MCFVVVLVGCIGMFDVIIFYDVLELICFKLGKIYYGEFNEDGSLWKDQLIGQIEWFVVELEVVLIEIELLIQILLNWKLGEMVNFWIEEDYEV